MKSNISDINIAPTKPLKEHKDKKEKKAVLILWKDGIKINNIKNNNLGNPINMRLWDNKNWKENNINRKVQNSLNLKILKS